MIQSPAGYQGDVRIKRYLDFYQAGYGVAMLSSGVAFSPLSLFAQGEQGGWYDPSDLTTMFQDAAGTTAAALESPVGLIRDKSGNGSHLSQSTSTARPVLSARVNLLVNTATLATQSVTTVATTYTLAFSGAGSITLSGTATGTYSAGSNTITCTAGTLTLTVSGTVTNADLRPANAGVGLPSYQRVGAATSGTSSAAGNADYDTTGFPYYLKFDGTDDFLVSGTISPGSVDKAQVFAGVRKLSDASYQTIASTGTPTTEASRFALFSTYNGGTRYAVQLSGTNASTLAVAETTNAFTAPRTNVASFALTVSASTTSNAISTKVNGTSEAVTELAAFSNPSTAFASGALNVGRRADGNFYYNGHLYSLILRFSATNLDAATIAATETWVNQKTLAY